MILLDTSGLLAAIDSSQQRHREAAAALLAARGPLLLSPFVMAELDYLLATRVGVDAELSFLMDRETRRFVVRLVDKDTRKVIRQIPAESVLRQAKDLTGA